MTTPNEKAMHPLVVFWCSSQDNSKRPRQCCVAPTGIRPTITDRDDRSGRRIWAHRPVQSTSLVGEDPYPPTVRPRSPVFCSLAGFGIFRLEGATGLVRVSAIGSINGSPMRLVVLRSVRHVDPTGDGCHVQVDLERIPIHRSHEFWFVAGVGLFRLDRATKRLRMLCHWRFTWVPHRRMLLPSSLVAGKKQVIPDHRSPPTLVLVFIVLITNPTTTPHSLIPRVPALVGGSKAEEEGFLDLLAFSSRKVKKPFPIFSDRGMISPWLLPDPFSFLSS